MPTSSDDPRLVVIHPPELAGTVLRLSRERQSLGRGRTADLQLDDPHLSSFHASLSHTAGQTSVEDLGSRNGTTVNGDPVRRPRVLRDGDVLQFGVLRARYEEPGGTAASPAVRHGEERLVRFDVERQAGGHINNVGRDQHNHYVQQRDSFLREVAAARTRSLRLIWLSLALIFGGCLVYLWGSYSAFSSVGSGVSDIFKYIESSGAGKPPSLSNLVGEQSFALSVALIGYTVAAGGIMLFLVALIMHVIAVARGRKVDSDPRHTWNAPVRRG
ncbi:FHA domain-containing protein [Streptosporangium sp. 'caverna']|uniref:FHA domain-containing protein n=1 Tax=Streptosporangium sp. 'caverna' TaxID=2202249 RepID=UPI0013A6BFEB|nr:FHA domain-containing protein [Streptosporangium sp. 'caverna']